MNDGIYHESRYVRGKFSSLITTWVTSSVHFTSIRILCLWRCAIPASKCCLQTDGTYSVGTNSSIADYSITQVDLSAGTRGSLPLPRTRWSPSQYKQTYWLLPASLFDLRDRWSIPASPGEPWCLPLFLSSDAAIRREHSSHIKHHPLNSNKTFIMFSISAMKVPHQKEDALITFDPCPAVASPIYSGATCFLFPLVLRGGVVRAEWDAKERGAMPGNESWGGFISTIASVSTKLLGACFGENLSQNWTPAARLPREMMIKEEGLTTQVTSVLYIFHVSRGHPSFKGIPSFWEAC